MKFQRVLYLTTLLSMSAVVTVAQNVMFSPVGFSTIHCTFPTYGSTTNVTLQRAFMYNGLAFSKIYISRNGFLAFSKPAESQADPISNISSNIIAPLWTATKLGAGDVTYTQFSSGSVLTDATGEITEMFPEFPTFSATYVLIVNWNVVIKSNSATAEFQVVLASDSQYSFVLFNYGTVNSFTQVYQAGFATMSKSVFQAIYSPTVDTLAGGTNVYIPKRWAYNVQDKPYVPSVYNKFYPVVRPNPLIPKVNGGNSPQVKLSQPFIYFGRSFNSVYINKNGVLSFTNPLSLTSPTRDASVDIIAPLWTNFTTDTRNIYYDEVSDSFLLMPVTEVCNWLFPNLTFNATWAFITTWDSVDYSIDEGSATFQLILVTDGNVSLALMKYRNVDMISGSWLSAYETVNNIYNYQLPVSTSTELFTLSSVDGWWHYRVDSGTPEACKNLCYENEVCDVKNMVIGCYCSQSPNPATFDAVETCVAENGSVSLSRCQLVAAGYNVSELHLKDPSCKGEVKEGRVIFGFDSDQHMCGGDLETNGTHLLYTNAVDAADGVITRDEKLFLTISCAYPLIRSLTMPMVFQATGSVVSKVVAASEGTYELHMFGYPDNNFTTPYTGNVLMEVNHEVFISVEMKGLNSSQVALVLDSCWATPVVESNSTIRWDLIINECPNPEDSTVKILQNGIAPAGHFSFNMFTFTDSSSTNIYLHCQVHLCLLVGGDCATTCTNGALTRRRRSLDFHDSASISMGF